MAEIRPNSGTLGKNRRKETEKHPDLDGFIHVDRNLLMDLLAKQADLPLVRLRLAAWNKNNGTTGEAFLSLSVSEPLPPKQDASKNPWEQ
jgi:hypothetical protein